MGDLVFVDLFESHVNTHAAMTIISATDVATPQNPKKCFSLPNKVSLVSEPFLLISTFRDWESCHNPSSCVNYASQRENADEVFMRSPY
jgi:hypothetical protein